MFNGNVYAMELSWIYTKGQPVGLDWEKTKCKTMWYIGDSEIKARSIPKPTTILVWLATIQNLNLNFFY